MNQIACTFFLMLVFVSSGLPALASQRCDQVLSGPKVVVYRALILDSDKAAYAIASNGMDSPYLINRQSNDNEYDLQLDPNPSNKTHRLIYQRYKKLKPGSLDNNPYMSISHYPDVAVAVAHSYRQDMSAPVYLFRLVLDANQIIRLGRDYPDPLRIRFAKFLGLNTVVKFKNGKKNVYRFDDRVESFVYWRILPFEITAVYKMPSQNAPLFDAGLRQEEEQQVTDQAFLDQLLPMWSPESTSKAE